MCVCMIALDAKAELEREMAAVSDSVMPAVKHQESHECVGMFEYRADEEQLLVDNLITGQCGLLCLVLSNSRMALYC